MLCVTGFICGLTAYMAAGSGVCKRLGVRVARTIGRVEEVGLGGLGEGQWGGGN